LSRSSPVQVAPEREPYQSSPVVGRVRAPARPDPNVRHVQPNVMPRVDKTMSTNPTICTGDKSFPLMNKSSTHLTYQIIALEINETLH
jgi:hypothetical protein